MISTHDHLFLGPISCIYYPFTILCQNLAIYVVNCAAQHEIRVKTHIVLIEQKHMSLRVCFV
ncbi:hypothetical protein HMPREF3232_00369 [Fannyhessea vaginae]|nr:hypothetical protein HMPREF3232_00369 [Fannyhessea vaginae]